MENDMRAVLDRKLTIVSACFVAASCAASFASAAVVYTYNFGLDRTYTDGAPATTISTTDTGVLSFTLINPLAAGTTTQIHAETGASVALPGGYDFNGIANTTNVIDFYGSTGSGVPFGVTALNPSSTVYDTNADPNIVTLQNSGYSVFDGSVTTDASGNIVAWSLHMAGNYNGNFSETDRTIGSTFLFPPAERYALTITSEFGTGSYKPIEGTYDYIRLGNGASFYNGVNNECTALAPCKAGTWTSQADNPAPIPAVASLLAFGCLGLRRRVACSAAKVQRLI
jgi:hypothetical protein